jgi:putative ABC transport system permease protein
MNGLIPDFRYALRELRKSPGFAAVAVLTLALGIGANTAVFNLLNSVLLRNLPVPHPEQLAEVKIVGGNNGMGLNQQYGELTPPLFQEIRAQQKAFSDVFAWGSEVRYTGRGSESRHFNGLWVSGNFFQTLGVPAWSGRLLMPDDGRVCPNTKAVASYAYWKRELGGRDLSTGIKLVADGDLVEVVGVTPPQFFGMVVGQNFDLALPLCQPKEGFRSDTFSVSVMGRLKSGYTLARASAELSALSAGVFAATIPPGYSSSWTEAYKRFQLAAYPASTGVSELREYDHSLGLLFAITGLVLLIACANLAALMLSRARSRAGDLAIRLALGATRARLLRQILAETIIIAVSGAALGTALAQWLARLLVVAISTEGTPVDLQIVTDWRVLLVAMAAAASCCVIFGLVPAIRATSVEPLSAMKAGGRRTTSSREVFSWQRGMVVAQISISLVLLVGALLFVRSFRNLLTSDPGMREKGITVAFAGFWQTDLPHEQWPQFTRQLLDEIRSIPGVLNAATATKVPLWPGAWEHGVHAGNTEQSSRFAWVSPEYFSTLDIPLVRGRGFSLQDTASSPRVAVVNETFVRQFFGASDPIGQTLRTNPEADYPSTVYEIVGVIPDSRYNDLRSPTSPMTFAPASQFPAPGPWSHIMIRSDLAPVAVGAAVRQALAQKHPNVIVETDDFQQGIRDGLIEERLMAMLSGFFGALAVLLAVIGLYGVMSYIVAMRWNEIGIRMALGASRNHVVGIVLKQTSRMLVLGVALGLALALIASRGASSLLFGLRANDPLTFAAASVALISIALLASYLPARRAAKVDPMVALRYE